MSSIYREFRNRDSKYKFIHSDTSLECTRGIYYDLCIFGAPFEMNLSAGIYRSKNQIFIDSSSMLDYLGKCQRFFIIEDGMKLIWTSFEGKSAIIRRPGLGSLYDFLFLQFCKPKQKVLALFNSFEACMAGFKNNVNVDAIEFDDTLFRIKEFQKAISNQELPF